MKQYRTQQGFTLVEMSIVLVIIGLIVGGVLVGQDLVKSAQIRAVVTQLGQYDAAINTFRGKFDGFPGDHAKADVFITGATAGNGDGRLTDSNDNATLFTDVDGELLGFWHQLSVANMVGGQYDGTSQTADAGFPSTKLKKGGLIAASLGSIPVYVVGTATDVSTGTDVAGANANKLAPNEAFGIDSKIDDGIANTGTVYHIISTTGTALTPLDATSGSATTNCYTIETGATDPADYNLLNEGNACTLVVRAQGS